MIIMGLVGILVMVEFILLLGYIGGIIAIYAANRQQKEIEVIEPSGHIYKCNTIKSHEREEDNT